MSERVSALIATYNYARYLPQCLGRVLNQTRPPDEIVVVDDGSTDGTPELMKQFPEVRYVYQQNAGKAAAFGRALSLSSGEIVCHLDADDYWEPDKLARVLHCLEKIPASAASFTRSAMWTLTAVPFISLGNSNTQPSLCF